jgi:hypothetical protein
VQLATASRRWWHGLTMAESAPTAGRHAWLSDANSFLFSAACHLVVLVLLGLCMVGAERGWQGLELLAQLSDSDDLPGDPQLETFKLQAAPDDSAAAGPERLFALAPAAMSDAPSIDSLFSISNVSGSLAGQGIGNLGDRLGGRVRDATEFFGLGGSGNSFVYVVDCSGSMGENQKLERACYELLQSIEQLGDDQRYFIIFYNDGAYPMDADRPVLATRNQFERTRHWVSYVVPGGGTYPLPALLHALSLEPDAIYFLSDGMFDPMTIAQLRAHNPPRHVKKVSGTFSLSHNTAFGDPTEPEKVPDTFFSDPSRPRQVPIHTVAFVNQEAQGLMRAIAHQSGGKFRFVP